MPMMSDVASDGISADFASTTVEASAAELNSKAPFEFDKTDVGLETNGKISSLEYELRFRPKEVVTLNPEYTFYYTFKSALTATGLNNPMYFYRLNFVEGNNYNDSTYGLVEYSLFYIEENIYGFAKTNDKSYLNTCCIDGIFYEDWKDASFDKSEYKALKKRIEGQGHDFDEDFQYYFELDNSRKSIGPFDFSDSVENEGVATCEFKNIQFERNYNVEFTFAYYDDDGSWFGGYTPYDLNCTKKKYVVAENGYSAALFVNEMSWTEVKERRDGFDNETTGEAFYKAIMSYKAKALGVAGIEKVSETNSLYANELKKYLNLSGELKTVRVFYLNPIEGTPFARLDTEKDYVDLTLSSLDLMTDTSGRNVVDAFEEYCNNKDNGVDFEVLGCRPDYVTEMTGEWIYNETGTAIYSKESLNDSSVDGFYKIHYGGGVPVQVTSEAGNFAYMTLGLNKSFFEYYESALDNGVDNIYENVGLSSHISTLDGVNVAEGLKSNIIMLYGENGSLGNKLTGTSFTELYGFWGFSVAPRDISFLCNTMKIFEDSNMGFSNSLVGYHFKHQKVTMKDYNHLLNAYGYGGLNWALQHVGSWISGYTGDFAIFYATSTENAVASYSGSIEWGDENPLWVNQMQVMGDLYKGSQLQRNLKIGMTILWFAAVILILVYAVSKFVSLCRVILPRDEELGLGHVTYNLDNSTNESHYDSHAVSFDHSKRKSNVQNKNTYGDTHIESSGDKQDYSTRENYIDNEVSSRDTIVNSSGLRTDNSYRTSEVRNENKYGNTTVNSNGSRTDNSRRRNEVRNENSYGSTTVNSNGPRMYNSQHRSEVRNENKYGNTTVNSNGSRTDNSHHRSEVRNENKYGDTTVNSSGSKMDNSYRDSEFHNQNTYGNMTIDSKGPRNYYRGSHFDYPKDDE